MGDYDFGDVATEDRDETAEAKVPPISGKMAKFLPSSGYYPLGGIGKNGTSPIVTTERIARLIPGSKAIMAQKTSSRVMFIIFCSFNEKYSAFSLNYACVRVVRSSESVKT